MISRRRFIGTSTMGLAAAAAGTSAARAQAGRRKTTSAREDRAALADKLREAASAPVLKTGFFARPVTIDGVELLRNGRVFLVRVRSTDGGVGIAEGHGPVLDSAWPILVKRVAPYFARKDARQLDALVDGVYVHNSNYKWQGLPFWASVASVELAVLDLLGQVSGRPVGELLGGVHRREIAVYRASDRRGNAPEDEVEHLQRIVTEDGATALKFRLGGRMRYDETTTRRDRALIPMVRRTFGDDVTLYADANGSYDVPKAVEIGRALQDHGFSFYEEPLPFDHYDETRQVADALAIRIAGGEEEPSLRQFRWMIETGVLQVVQPDMFYFGGMTRAMRVARMAQAAGLECTPHMSGSGLGFLYAAHFASCAPAHGPHQEYKGTDDLPVSSPTSPLRAEKGVVRVPSGPGLGVVFEPGFLHAARVLEG